MARLGTMASTSTLAGVSVAGDEGLASSSNQVPGPLSPEHLLLLEARFERIALRFDEPDLLSALVQLLAEIVLDTLDAPRLACRPYTPHCPPYASAGRGRRASCLSSCAAPAPAPGPAGPECALTR